MRSNILAPGLLALAVVTGCAPVRLNPLRFVTEQAGYVTTVDPPLVFDVAGPVGVRVESFNGDVIVETDPDARQAKVIVTRAARHGSLRAREARESLAQISASAWLVSDETGPVIQVSTRTSHAEPHFQRAHVHVILPEVLRTTVRTSNGRVSLEGIWGPVDVQVTSADVRVETDRALTDQVTILVGRRGDIDYRVRGESTAALDCQSVRGQVINRVRTGTLTIHRGSTDQRLVATLNGGSNPVVLRTAEGDIRIAVVPDPFEFQAVMFNHW